MQKAQVIDLADALKRAMNDVPFLRRMFDEFQQILPGAVAGIRQSADSGAWDQLRKNAHQLKGSAASLSAGGIALAALELELIGKNGNFADAGPALDRLNHAVEEFQRQLALIDWDALRSA